MLIAYSNTTNAQTTATPNLNIIINPLLNITATGPAHLTYSTITDYTGGKDSTAIGQLSVTSILPYTVSVKGSGDFMNGTNSIALGNVVVTAPATPNNQAVSLISSGISNVQTPSLTTSSQAVFGGTWAFAAPIDVEYKISSTNSMTANGSGGVLGAPTGTYTAQLTYTISNP